MAGLFIATGLTLMLLADIGTLMVTEQKALPLLPSFWVAVVALGCAIWAAVAGRRAGARRWLRAMSITLIVVDALFVLMYGSIGVFLAGGPVPYK